jgi:hypothetical protein
MMKQQHIPKWLDLFHLGALLYLLVYGQWSAQEEPLRMSRHLSCHSLFDTWSTLDLNAFEDIKQEYEFSNLPNFLHFL